MRSKLVILVFFLPAFCYSQKLINRLSISCGIATTRNTPNVYDFYLPISKYNYHEINSPYFRLGYSSKLTRSCDFNAALQFLTKGTKSEYNFAFSSGVTQHTSYKYLLSYIEIPLQFDLKKRKYSFHVGIIPAYLSDVSFLFEETIINPKSINPIANSSYRHVVNPRPLFNDFDLGCLLGVSKTINQKFDLEIRFQKSMMKPYHKLSKELMYQQTFLFGIRYCLGKRF